MVHTSYNYRVSYFDMMGFWFDFGVNILLVYLSHHSLNMRAKLERNCEHCFFFLGSQELWLFGIFTNYLAPSRQEQDFSMDSINVHLCALDYLIGGVCLPWTEPGQLCVFVSS